MGNDQSRSSVDGKEDDDRPLDYYALLQVDEEATADEIKRSYRKLALINHPDKNPHRVEEATKLFADLQQAYEILSDPNERAFYDKHRDDHLEPTDNDFYDHVRAGDAAVNDPKSKMNKRRPGDPGIKLEQLMRFFDPKLARKMDDSTEGFFSVYRTLFNVLASDEALHTPNGQSPFHYPPFGDSTTPYAPPPGLTKAERAKSSWARDFYTVWGEFTTEKRFEWLEKWDSSRGEERTIRRLMEKENKKVREDHRKEYIDTVKTLVSFVQHRDPRYKSYQAKIAQEKKTKGSVSGSSTPNRRTAVAVDAEAARLREEARMQAAAAYEEQDWQRISSTVGEASEEVVEQDVQEGDGTGIRLDDGAGGEMFECVACNKTFQSEASWSNHERSKKHKQAVWRLAKEMKAEALDFDEDDFHTPDENNETDVSEDSDDIEDHLDELDITCEPEHKPQTTSSDQSDPEPQPPVSSVAMSDPQIIAADNQPGDDKNVEPSAKASSTPIAADKKGEQSKREKRREKEARRKADEEAQKLAAKEAKKAARKGGAVSQHTPSLLPTENDDAGDKFVQPKRKQAQVKKTKAKEKESFGPDDVERAISVIQSMRTKMIDKWGNHWIELLKKIGLVLLGSEGGQLSQLNVLCLGLGKPSSDRTAQIQLAFILELTIGLGCNASDIEFFDPVFTELDRLLLKKIGCVILEDNLSGKHVIQKGKPQLIYMPHCSKVLYESFLSTNFSPTLGASPKCVILGNDLGEYLPDFVRDNEAQEGGADEFVKPKKKRKGRGVLERQIEDGVLRRLVPHFSVISLLDLPETNLPGFARAFLSLCFQWLPDEKVLEIDWETPLPSVEWPQDGEVIP